MPSQPSVPSERSLLVRAMVFAVALHALVLALPVSLLIGKESGLTDRDVTFLIEAILGQEEKLETSETATAPPPIDEAFPPEEEPPPPVVEATEPVVTEPPPAEQPVELTADSSPAPAIEPAKTTSELTETIAEPRGTIAEPIAAPDEQETLQKLEERKEDTMDLESPPPGGPARAYLERLRAKIAAAAFFPHQARLENARGKVVVQVKILRNGAVKEISIVKRSGFRCLDNAARLAVERAAPFEPLDQFVDMEYLRVNVPFRY